MKSVAIVGGGITGLTAAFRLRQRGIPVTVYESGNRAGGVIQSFRRDGFLAEAGPNTLLETSPRIGSLICDLGLESRRLYSNPASEDRYVVRNGRPVKLPTTITQFVRTPLFSTAAKCRLLAEPFIAPTAGDQEESVEQFVLRRLGQDFLDYAINPLVGGVYAGSPGRLSVKYAFPRLHALERKYHSLILGQIFGARERKRRAEVSKQKAKKISFDDGLQTLTDEISLQLGDAVRLATPVDGIAKTSGGWKVGCAGPAGRETGEHSAVLFCGTAHSLARLPVLADRAPKLHSMTSIYYPPVASVVFGFQREDVAHPLEGFGMLVPEVERFNILGTIFSSSIFPDRAPAGHVLLTSYVGGARSAGLVRHGPDEIFEMVFHDLKKLLGVRGKPLFQHHHVFTKAIPQYEIGYGRFLELIRQTEEACPGFFLAGHYRDGISLADSIVSGDRAAARVANHLGSGKPELAAGEMKPALTP